jgi:hypothetical protein
MEIGFVIALVIAIPIILFPAAFLWYINVSGLWQVMKDARERRERRARANRQLLTIRQEGSK